jgi:hypothetical protein
LQQRRIFPLFAECRLVHQLEERIVGDLDLPSRDYAEGSLCSPHPPREPLTKHVAHLLLQGCNHGKPSYDPNTTPVSSSSLDDIETFLQFWN